MSTGEAAWPAGAERAAEPAGGRSRGRQSRRVARVMRRPGGRATGCRVRPMIVLHEQALKSVPRADA